MTIVSVSLNENLLEDLDKIQEQHGYTGRSEVIRAAIRTLIQQKNNLNQLNNEEKITAVLNVTHHDKDLETISQIQHKHQNIIQTQIHDHIQHHKCLQTYILQGKTSEIKELYNKFETSKKTQKTQLNTL